MTDDERTAENAENAENHETATPIGDAWSPETAPAATEPETATFGTAETGAEADAGRDAQSDSAQAARARIAELERRIADLERQVTTERDAASDYMQRWQRAQADFSNYKRRTQQEQEQREFITAGRALATIFPALDSFERAFTSLPASLRGYSWIDGVALVELQLRRALDAVGIQLIAAEPGAAFDPMRHESIGEVESDAHPAGHIGAVLQQGYEVRGLILRPALVQLAKAPATTPPESAAESATAGYAASDNPAESATAGAATQSDNPAESATTTDTARMEEAP